MGLSEALQNVWSSDYVQKNPKQAYKASYAGEYTAVQTFLNGGAEPNWSGYSRLGKGLCEIEAERRKAVEPIPPEPVPPEPIPPEPVPTPPAGSMLFDGDFETGNTSQWSGLSDETTVGTITGKATLRTSYTTGTGLVITPAAGATAVAMMQAVLKPNPTAETRAEWVKNYDYAQYHGKSCFFTFALLLDPDYNWAIDFTGGANNSAVAPVLAQVLTRNLVAGSVMVHMHPAGWQGENAMSLSLSGRGGLSPSPSTEHRLGCNTAIGNGWTTLLAPATAETSGSQREPQIIGPHCQQGQAIALTVGEWWEFIIQVDCQTQNATGGYTAWVRKKGSGSSWAKTLETPRIYKTVQWGSGQAATASGVNNTHRVGGYTAYLPRNLGFFWDQFTISTTFALAESQFAKEI